MRQSQSGNPHAMRQGDKLIWICTMDILRQQPKSVLYWNLNLYSPKVYAQPPSSGGAPPSVAGLVDQGTSPRDVTVVPKGNWSKPFGGALIVELLQQQAILNQNDWWPFDVEALCQQNKAVWLSDDQVDDDPYNRLLRSDMFWWIEVSFITKLIDGIIVAWLVNDHFMMDCCWWSVVSVPQGYAIQ